MWSETTRRIGRQHTVAVVMATSLAVATACSTHAHNSSGQLAKAPATSGPSTALSPAPVRTVAPADTTTNGPALTVTNSSSNVLIDEKTRTRATVA